MPILDLGKLSDSFIIKAPVGTIVIWSGTADDIPNGWHICDGTEGTPDLRGKFVLGAGNTHSVGEEGGEEEVTLTKEQLAEHQHVVIRRYGSNASISSTDSDVYGLLGTGGSTKSLSTGAILDTKNTGMPHNNMPPYYTLLYIMKLENDATDVASQGGMLEEYGPSKEVSTDIAIANGPVQVISEIKYIQEGEGTPSLTNVRNITGFDTIELTHQYGEDLSREYTQNFSETVYGGEYDWSTGRLTLTHKLFSLSVDNMNNSEDFPGWSVPGLSECFDTGINTGFSNIVSNICNSVRINTNGSNTTLFFLKSAFNLTQSQFKEQHSGLNCQFLFPLLERKVIQLAPKEIYSFKGRNSFTSNCGDTKAIFYVNIKEYIEHGNVYMEEETRIGTWIDGKPLYRKVGHGTIAESVGTASDILKVPYANFISWNGYIENGVNRYPLDTFQNPFSSDSGSFVRTYIGSNGNANSAIRMLCYSNGDGTPFANMPVTIIAEYTKNQ